MKCRVKFLVKTYLWTVLVFVLAKVAFVLFCRNGHEVTFNDMTQVISHGITLDLSTALYFLIIPFLLCIVNIWYWTKWLSKLLRSYFLLISLAFALAFVADTSLYPFWDYKLDSSCLQYLETPNEMVASVSVLYIIIRIVAFAITAIVIFGGYRHLTPASHRTTALPKYVSLILYIIAIPFIVIGIRGGLDESTTNTGQVYYSQNQFLNHSAVNPVFNFLASFEGTVSDIVEYSFFNDTECKKLLEGCYSQESAITDSLLNTERPNVVIILMESASEVFAEAMPRLNQLKREGINFSNCYGNTYRTDRGTVCTLSGYPSFPTMSVMKMPTKAANMPSIAKSLKGLGYATSYLYGGDINFTDMRSYLISTGWEKLYWKADYTQKEQGTAKWGVRDDITFETLYNQICSTDTTARFLMGYSTLSSHEPWDVPIKKFEDEKMNAFYYLDQCIGNFIDKLKGTPYWKDLLIILTPDHGINYNDIDETRQVRNHIPMLWIGGAVKKATEVKQLCNQTDLAATLLGQMGISHSEFTFSRDVLSSSYTKPYAYHCYNNGFSVVDSSGFTVFDLNSMKTIVGNHGNAVNLGKAILQTTSKDLKERK